METEVITTRLILSNRKSKPLRVLLLSCSSACSFELCTISKMNMARSKNSNGRKIRSPIRSLVQLQDSYQCDHLPFKMKEHIEDELDNIDTTRTVQFVGD